MEKFLVTLGFLILVHLSCPAQKQANVWYFGNHAGIDFNGGFPIALNDGQTYLQQGLIEGTSVICDSSGNLLFYSNGETIWNRNHQVMCNGDSLLSSYSSTQSSLILPLPGTDGIFYHFTTDAFVDHDLRFGFRFSVVDMCLDNGLGAIINGQKSILILDTVAEKLTAVRHPNGIDYWVIVHKYYSDAFHAFLFTANGIVDTTVTHIGSIHGSTTTAASIGYMKASPDGRRLAVVSFNPGGHLKEVFDFDANSGVVSNFLDLHLPDDSTQGGYGASFSPDNSKLYIESNPNHVFQYDLSAGGGNPDSIRASRYHANFLTSNNLSLQLGPDGKLYATESNRNYLSVFEYPNLRGSDCGFVENAIPLLGGTCSFGLPNIVDSYSYSNGIPFCPVGISGEGAPSNSLRICPNPVRELVRVELPEGEAFNLEIRDATGRMVRSVEAVVGACSLECAHLAAGVYFLRAINASSMLTCRFVKE